MAPKWFPPNLDDLIQRYLAGASVNQLSGELGVSRRPITEALLRVGVNMRGQSAAETVKWGRMAADQRERQVAAAHDAVRGTKRSMCELIKRAKSDEQRPRNVGAHERTLFTMLTDRGLSPIFHQAVGPYSCDIGAFPIAVEIWGGEWHWSGRHAARTPERFRYFMDRGWHVFVVNVVRNHPLTPEVADNIVALYKIACTDPPAVREYRVVRRAGEVLLSGNANDRKITLVKTITNRRNAASGRYESVSR